MTQETPIQVSPPPQVDIGMSISPDFDIASNISKNLSMPDKSKTNKTSEQIFHGQDRSSDVQTVKQQNFNNFNKVMHIDDFTDTVLVIC